MRVALGTIEVSDEERKAIRAAAGGKGDATRGEVKEYLLTALKEEIIPYIGTEGDVEADASVYETDESEEDVTEQPEQTEQEQTEGEQQEGDKLPEQDLQHGVAPEPVSDEELPEPSGDSAGATSGVTATTGTSGISTGNLGSAGTPGGTSSDGTGTA